MRALILAGHGSHISPDTAGVVWSYVDQLRQWEVADEITACFWKEAPAFSQVLDTLVSEDVTIVPVFTATGYFSQTVIPAEMGLAGPLTMCGSRTIRHTRTIGEHPALRDIVYQRVTETLQTANLNPQETAIAIIGHGTARSARSQNTTAKQVAVLQARGLVAEVVAAYLDTEPDIASIYDRTKAPVIVAVPFFLATGSHVTQDVPQALGLEPLQTQAQVNGRQVFYTPPVGTHEAICQIILDLASEHSQPFDIRQLHRDSHSWAGFPTYGSDQLVEAVKAQGQMRFGELELRPTEVRPTAPTDSGVTQIVETPPALREVVREAPFRPHATASDLPGGWCVPVRNPDDVPAIVETIYPGAVADWARNQRSEFHPQTLREVAQRQTGIFRAIHDIGEAVIDATIHRVCGQCVRQPTWATGKTGSDAIPCQAPCNWWLSQAKEAV